jgi:hypothetical protein
MHHHIYSPASITFNTKIINIPKVSDTCRRHSSDDGENTISCGEPLTVITKKNRDAEIPPVSRAIVNDELKHPQCEESEGNEDKIKLKEGDKVRVIAQNDQVQLQADGIFFFEEGSFDGERVFVDAEHVSDQEIKFEVP